MAESRARLFIDLTRRELSNRLISTASGWLWLLVNPLLLLLVYAFVFGVIFQARAPADVSTPFVAWLAVALWPWLAFSEGILRGSQAIQQHAALIAKVAVPRFLLTSSVHGAAFLLQIVGYLIILVVLSIIGVELHYLAIPYVLLVLLSLYVFSLGLALGLSALQVFVRDLEHLLPTFMMFWFFMTPILYAEEILPGNLAAWLQLNPMLWWMEEIRAGLFQGKWLPDLTLVFLLASAFVTLGLGKLLFDRLSPHFEDFL